MIQVIISVIAAIVTVAAVVWFCLWLRRFVAEEKQATGRTLSVEIKGDPSGIALPEIGDATVPRIGPPRK